MKKSVTILPLLLAFFYACSLETGDQGTIDTAVVMEPALTNTGVSLPDIQHAVTFALNNAFTPKWLCAEFVSRSLCNSGFFPGFSASKTSSFSNFHGYNLTNVGHQYSWGYKKGLYDYLVGYKYAAEITTDFADAEPGDVVFYYTKGKALTGENRMHVAIITYGRGTGSLVCAHNKAYKNIHYNAYSSFTAQLVHLKKIWITPGASGSPWIDDAPVPCATTTTSGVTVKFDNAIVNPNHKNFYAARNISIEVYNGGVCTLNFETKLNQPFLVMFNYHIFGSPNAIFQPTRDTLMKPLPLSSTAYVNTFRHWSGGACFIKAGGLLGGVYIDSLYFYHL